MYEIVSVFYLVWLNHWIKIQVGMSRKDFKAFKYTTLNYKISGLRPESVGEF